MEAAGATADAKIFMGSGFFWPAPVGLRKLAQDSLDPEEYAVIPSDALIILEHQGHTFAWLDPTDPATTVYVSQPVDADVLAKSHDNTCALR